MKKRKTELNNLDKAERTETRTRRRIQEEKPQVLAQTPPPSTHEKVELVKEETQPLVKPPEKESTSKET